MSDPHGASENRPFRVHLLFGTRPEVVKLAPVALALEGRPERFRTLHIASGQHPDLLYPFARTFGLRVDHDLEAGGDNLSVAAVCQRVIGSLTSLLERERPDVLLVQGDTTTTLAGALAAFYQRIPVGHIEAGLRSGARNSPFPEEMNRRLITQLASFHFAATPYNVETLVSDGVPPERIALTGNPVVDAVEWALEHAEPSPEMLALLGRVGSRKLLVLTTHRRESFGQVMVDRLSVLQQFVERHEDMALVFPVHPNPEVQRAASQELEGCQRIHLIEPVEYLDFIHLLAHAWLIVSDSGGIQEEAPTLGKAVLIIRDNTERPEAIEAGVARLVGRSARALEVMLESAYADETWISSVKQTQNPFGKGDAGPRIARALEQFLKQAPS